MSETKIDKNVPTPPLYRKYPFRKMAVGDSFQMESKNRHPLDAGANAFKKRHPETAFTVRKVGENLYRVWRIK